MLLKIKGFLFAGGLCLLLAVFIFPFPPSAEALSYDPYAPVYQEEPKAPSVAEDISAHFLTYPFEILRWPVDRGLVYIEKYHLDEKFEWLYNKTLEQGITPHFNIMGFGNGAYGVDVDFIRLARQKEHFPDLTVQSWIDYSQDVIFEVGSTVKIDHIADTGLHTYGVFKYEDRPEEHFYGIGPDTSAGEGTSFTMEATTLEAVAGYTVNPTLIIDFKYAYRHVHISEGEDEGRGQIARIFPPATIPGLDGDTLNVIGVEVNHDTRNHKADSSKGGQQRFSFSFNEGVGASDARYFKYEAEVSQYIPLFSERRVLVIHFYGEHNDEIGDHNVPFHQMAKLGDYGTYPRLSHTLRGFDFNRFFDESAALMNLEYRYTIWQYRDYKMDTLIFWDEGQAFGEFSDFQFSDFRESYGLGFRLTLARNILVTVQAAHGDEGTRLYVKTNAPF